MKFPRIERKGSGNSNLDPHRFKTQLHDAFGYFYLSRAEVYTLLEACKAVLEDEPLQPQDFDAATANVSDAVRKLQEAEESARLAIEELQAQIREKHALEEGGRS